MPDYLKEVGRTARLLSVVGLSLTTFILGLSTFLIVYDLASGRVPARDRGLLTAAGLLFGLLLFASGWMLLRLLRRTRSANGVTMMPAWFIQAFGVLLGGLVLLAAIVGRQWLFTVQGAGVIVSMIFVPRLLQQGARHGS